MDVGRVSFRPATDDIAGNWSAGEAAHILVFSHDVSSVTVCLYHIWHHSSASRLLVGKFGISLVSVLEDNTGILFLTCAVCRSHMHLASSLILTENVRRTITVQRYS
jgi:hypothetical protein